MLDQSCRTTARSSPRSRCTRISAFRRQKTTRTPVEKRHRYQSSPASARHPHIHTAVRVAVDLGAPASSEADIGFAIDQQ
jgi:hypothetical protein